MIDRDSPVTEDELHAYVDGELPAERLEAVGAWLAAHPSEAATGRRLAGAGGRDPRALRRDRRRAGARRGSSSTDCCGRRAASGRSLGGARRRRASSHS